MEFYNYVLGIAYSAHKNKVLLMKKNRPNWQKGLLNGIGGKIEINETPEHAITRECYEECGLYLDWNGRGKMFGRNNDGSEFLCYIFYAYDDSIFDFIQKEDEELFIYDIKDVFNFPLIPNLHFLIPFGLFDDNCPVISLHYLG